MEKEIKYPILAIDYGDKHFGLAISDIKGILAQPLQTLSITKNKKVDDIITEILEIANEYRSKTILVGLPQEFIPTHQKTTKKINKFISLLNKVTDIPIITYDESFSTTRAQNMLTSSGQNTKKTKGKINSIAATVFLQDFLNSKKYLNEKR